jgi:hypothetical protein
MYYLDRSNQFLIYGKIPKRKETMRQAKLTVILSIALFLVSIVSYNKSLAQGAVSVIDFEGIPAGTIVDSVYSGFGISGAPIEGEVIVDGFNPRFGEDVNAAMIFDATCPPGNIPADCSGGDSDLFNPDLGNTLIISADLNGADPDDGDEVGSIFGFEYTLLGDGNGVYVESITVHDVEEEETEDARMYFFEGGLGGTLLFSVDIPETGDGQTEIVPVNVDNVDAIEVDLQGSGTIDNVRLSTSPTAVELLYFRVVKAKQGEVVLNWATAAEIDNYGFYLYRTPHNDLSKVSKINEIHFEPAGGGTAGHSYSFTDSPGNGGPYWYWLSDVDTKGKTTYHMPAIVWVVANYYNFLPISISK